MIESIAESNDALLEKYLEGGEISPDELSKGLKDGFINGTFVPVFAGAGIKNIGAQPFIEFVQSSTASPMDRRPMKAVGKDGAEVVIKADPNGPMTALVFKTIADPYAGKLSIFRVFSGTMKADSTVNNTTKGTKERIGQIMYIRGKARNRPTRRRPAISRRSQSSRIPPPAIRLPTNPAMSSFPASIPRRRSCFLPLNPRVRVTKTRS